MATTVTEVQAGPMAVGPRYSVLSSTDSEAVEAAQRLRRQVLTDECGYAAAGSRFDADHFDDHCVHVLVRDNRTEELVGCARMLPTGGVFATGGMYAAKSFDLTALDPLRLSLLEWGHAVVRADHRNGAVLLMMWSAILDYADRYGYDHIFGCITVPTHPLGSAPGAQVRAVHEFMRHDYAGADCYTVRPHRPVVIDGVPLGDITPLSHSPIPALVRGYLRLGARMCGEPAHDPLFRVAHFPTLLGTGRFDGGAVLNRL
ncbi:GNAT family N-acetyltransferase [Mycolicibacterium goodii]|uniref:GNAT family N-acetyltransferase n=1 Tax=Mycolicibacterium goodii TaxID=134601 RepID=A0ABS6HLA3_MYCGD|nr:GNAT family N-acyltransferase [Mycolicibacterium goodii]MBU8823454.1 GNAT family N-acetyltransferase [Mycolicibacterium goodii]MBU8835497.1 GNAT family N-acetyltransferase [Mycolicibacterium goodii]